MYLRPGSLRATVRPTMFMTCVRYRPGPIEPSPRTDVGAELDEALSCEIVEIELQSVQASSVTRARHCCATPIFAADRLQKSQQKLVSKIDAGACPLHLKKPTFHEAMIMSALGQSTKSLRSG